MWFLLKSHLCCKNNFLWPWWNRKIMPFWGVSESQISKFSSTMVKVLLRQKTVQLVRSGGVSERHISKFSSTMVKVWLRQKTVKLDHSEPTAPADAPLQADVYFHLFFRAITTFFGQKIAQPPPQIFWARAPMYQNMSNLVV